MGKRGTVSSTPSSLRLTTPRARRYNPGQMPSHFGTENGIERRRVRRGSVPARNYKPIASVWGGDDAELIEQLLRFYPHKRPRRILDATVNHGRFWRGSKRRVIGLDVEARYKPSIVGDNMRMPFRDASVDVIVYDPPHVPNQGRDKQKDFTARFGLGMKSLVENGHNFSHLYKAFVGEAYRVLKPKGVLFCKVADYVHNHRLQWAHVELAKFAAEAGFCPCDCIVKIRKGPIVDPKWKTAHHARRHHCYWLIFRKSDSCE